MNIPAEFAKRIKVSANGCWTWTGWVSGYRNRTGSLAPYPCFQRNKKVIKAHRYFFELATGISPNGFHVHHRCKNTLCVNPEHLEVIAQSDHNKIHDAFKEINSANLARKTCSHGHEWTKDNTHITKSGVRHCRACRREAMRKFRVARGIGIPKTHCPNGHPYSGTNLYISPRGHRRCKECNRARYHIRKAHNDLAPPFQP